MFERYAIFYTAPSGAFADFGAAWLGWDSAKAKTATHPEILGIDIHALTATPRKYGFHATLKAPFHLAADCTEDALHQAVEIFAQTHAAEDIGHLVLTATHGFLALRPADDPCALRQLAGAIVTDIDPFRAPMTETDIARRRRSRLTPRQDQQMLDWGYPFVFEDFNFHMTLTGSLRKERPEVLLPLVSAVVSPVSPQYLRLDAITLMGQDGQGMFHQIHRVPLTGD